MCKGIMQYSFKTVKTASIVYDRYINNVIVKPLHREAIFNHKLGQKLHFNPVVILPYSTVLKDTHLIFQVGG